MYVQVPYLLSALKRQKKESIPLISGDAHSSGSWCGEFGFFPWAKLVVTAPELILALMNRVFGLPQPATGLVDVNGWSEKATWLTAFRKRCNTAMMIQLRSDDVFGLNVA